MNWFSRWFWGFMVAGLLGGPMITRADVPQPEYLTVRSGLPQGFVKSMLQDQRGFIWMATRDGLCRYDGVRFRIYNHDAQQPNSLSFSSILEIEEDVSGRLWVRTENNNVDCFDPVTEQSRHVSDSAPFRRALGRDQLMGIQPDRFGNVWVATRSNGFFQLKANGSISHRHRLMPNDSLPPLIQALLLDRSGRIWLATRDGLFRYGPTSGRFVRLGPAQGLPQPDVQNLHERANGELMLGFPGRFALLDPVSGRIRRVIDLPDDPDVPLFATDYRGTDYVDQNRYADQTGLVPLTSNSNGPTLASLLRPKLVRFPALSLLVDRSNVLWIGTNGDGVIKYDLNQRPFRSWSYAVNFQTDWLTRIMGVPDVAVPAIIRNQWPFDLRYLFDRRNVLWIGGPTVNPYRYDAFRQTFDPVPPTGIEARWLPGNVFRLTTLATGPQGELWGLLGPDGRAVVRHNPALHTFTAFPLPLPPNNPYQIMAMTVDGGRIYLATKEHGLLRADLSAKRLVHWYAGGADARSLPNNALLSLAQDPVRYNHLWIGTFGSGLCRLDKLTGQIRRFTTEQGLSNNVVYAIRPDGRGHLWLSTNRGLCRFDTRTYEVRNYTANDGLPGEEFNRFHDVKLPDNRLVFGGVGGYTAFDPRRIIEDRFAPVVALTALRVNNRLVNTSTPDSPLRRVINETSEVVLNDQQNFLSFDFAALQFNQNDKNQYRYKLTGIDNDWVYSGNQATATYTNLSPGTYTFVVNASNTSGIWSPYSHQVRVVIEPPLWATWWAYAAYGLLLVGAIVLFLRSRINRIRLKSRAELREQESIQLKNLDAVKSRFFANITHEFRTPLTLILTPLEQILHDTTDAPYHSRLKLVYTNANRLLRLINELLDLAKLDAGSLAVTPAPGDLAEFIDRTVLLFGEEARRKNIDLRVSHYLPQPYYWFDADKIEKIVNNLLSNALKFTNPGGLITLSTHAEPAKGLSADPTPTDLIQLTVHNTGTGIADYKLSHLFDRFYQADPLADGAAGGSGIGLALVKELVEIMQGTISVSSQPGSGTAFRIELPCRPAHAAVTTAVHQLPSGSSAVIPSEVAQNAPRLLVVEDNDDIAEYVTAILTTEWRVYRVNTGRAGIEAALADGPDMIISDVLMPEMDGYELCRQLKANPVTSHIPILLLTAKASVESRLEGLQAGADDYVAKPFQVEELRGRVRNRLEQQHRTRQYYRTQLLREGHLPTVSPAPEDDFMNRVYAVLEARLDDSTFGVEPLANAVGMSRMHLNRKIKAMTGLTPNELIRGVRLNYAVGLLLTGTSVSETADRVGFDTPAYFSKVFKDQYHLTPSEYVEKHRHEVV